MADQSKTDVKETSLSVSSSDSCTSNSTRVEPSPNHKTVTGRSGNNQSKDISKCLINVNTSLSSNDLCVFKLAISTLRRVNSHNLESMKLFTEAYRLLEQSYSEQDALSITVYILKRLKVKQEVVDSFSPFIDTRVEFPVKDYRLLDYVLSLWNVVFRMSSEVYSGFIDFIQRRCLQNYNINKFTENRVYLIQVLMERDFLKQDNLVNYCEWISDSGASSLCEHLKDLCTRQGWEVPVIKTATDSSSHAQTNRPSSSSPVTETQVVGSGSQCQASSSPPTGASESSPLLADKSQSNGSTSEKTQLTTNCGCGYTACLNCWKKLSGCQKCAIVFLSVLCLLALSGFMIVLAFSIVDYNHIKYHNKSSPKVYDVGSYATTLIQCYNPKTAKSILIRGELSDTITFYTVRKNDLVTSTDVLLKESRKFNKSSDGNVALGYSGGDTPLYIANRGNITYSFNSTSGPGSQIQTGSEARIGSHSKICDFQLFLFSSFQNYTSFTGSSNPTPIKFDQNSTCFHLPKGQNTSGNFSFLVTRGGYFYVAGHLSANIFFNISITGYITTYNISNANRVCSLNTNTGNCKVDITEDEASNQPLCILSHSNTENTRSVNVTVTPNGYKYYDYCYLIGIIGFVILFLILSFALFTVISFFIVTEPIF